MKTRPLAPCGTYGAYQRHLKRGETPCPACRNARADHQHRYREENPVVRLYDRNQSSAYRRAETRLRERYPNVFARLYAEEMGRA